MAAPEISLTPGFTKSLNRLTANEQNAVRRTVFQFMEAPDSAGARLHALDCKEKRFASISVSMDLRIIVLRDGPRFALMHVDHHDQAYRWAERRKVETHEVTGSAQIVQFEEVIREEVVIVPRAAAAAPLFAGESDAYLLSLGVPRLYLPTVRQVADEDALLGLVDHLPEEAMEALMALAEGERPAAAPVAAPGADPFATPDARRRFWVAADEAAMRQALERPWQEWLVFLHPSQADAASRNFNGPARVSGSAGTGKSVVAMHRAARMARESQGGRVFVTTYSQALAARLAQGMDALLGHDAPARKRVAVTTLHAEAQRVLREAGLPCDVADDGAVAALLEARRADLDRAAWPPQFLLNEWKAVIDHWGVRDWESYRDVRRLGRGEAMSPKRRKEVWPVFDAVRRALDAAGKRTWADVCEHAAQAIFDSGAAPYRHVVVDEAQDLGPRELAFAASLAAAGPRALFFVGDAGQQIHRYPFSWRSVGVDVRGRARRLTVNYRTSAQIRRFADRLMPQSVDDGDGVEEARAALSLFSGPQPEVIACADTAAQRDALGAWLAGHAARGAAPNEIAVLARLNGGIDDIAVPAIKALAWGVAPLGDAAPDPRAVYVGALHDAKGLEFRAVAIVGADDALMPLRAALAAEESDEGRALALERERHLLYVGCTRARESLLITHGPAPSRFLAP